MTPKRINILFVMLQMEMGGTERLVYNLARKLDRRLFNPSIAWFFGNKILKEFEELDIPLYHVPKIKRIDFCAMQKLGETITQKNIHVINTHHFMPMVYSFYGSKIKNRAKLFYTEHSEWEIKQISWKWKILGHHLLKRADGAIGVSAPVSKQIRENFRADDSKNFVIHNGIEFDAFTADDGKSAVRNKIGLSNRDKVIGVVANFRKIKNHLFLLKAFSEIVNVRKNIKLLLIGQGFEFDPENSEQEIRDFVNEKKLNKNVLFLGYRSDIPALLHTMDVFCLTSLKEGLPISLIEAMAAGLPVVGTDTTGIRDVVIPNRNGLLTKIGDVDHLKQCLYTLLQNEVLRKKFGEQSRILAKEKYSMEQCVERYQDLFLMKQ